MYQRVNSTLFLPLGLQHKPTNFRKPMAQAISLRTPPRHEEFNIVSIHPLRWSCLPSQMSGWLSLIFLWTIANYIFETSHPCTSDKPLLDLGPPHLG